MNTQQTLDRLSKLKLNAMKDVYQALLETPIHNRPSVDAIIARMAEAETLSRIERRTAMYLKTSRLRYSATIEDIHCNTERNLSKEQMLHFAQCDFVKRAQNLLITGSTGCGKSFLACAIGRQACHLGLRTLYISMGKFIEKIAYAKVDGTFLKLVNNIEKHDLIIFDDFGLQPLDANSRLALLQILEDRYERKAIIITSQLPVAKWYDYIDEPTIADAIMDRITSNADRIDLKGESMRHKNRK